MNTNAESRSPALTIAWGILIAAVSLLIIAAAIRRAARDMAATQAPSFRNSVPAENTEQDSAESRPLPAQASAIPSVQDVSGPVMSPEDKARLIKDLREQAEASEKSPVGPSSLALTEDQIRFIEEHDLVLQ